MSLGWFLGLAMVLHGSLMFLNGIPGRETKITAANPSESFIEIEKAPSQERKSVVQSSKSEEEFQDNKPAEYAGEFRNRVKKETQARVIGPFQEGRSASESSKKEGQGGENSGKAPSDEGDPIPTPGGEAGPKISDLMITGRSPHFLSDKIEKGNETVLNTDKVLYASFINRIAEEIYQPWVGNIEEALKNLRASGRKLENNTYVTKLNVAMDKRGEITGIQILSSCGVAVIDEAPKRAFWEAEPFPNPPVQLIEEDGFIRLNYEFHFEWKSSGFNIVPMTI